MCRSKPLEYNSWIYFIFIVRILLRQKLIFPLCIKKNHFFSNLDNYIYNSVGVVLIILCSLFRNDKRWAESKKDVENYDNKYRYAQQYFFLFSIFQQNSLRKQQILNWTNSQKDYGVNRFRCKKCYSKRMLRWKKNKLCKWFHY